MFQSDMEKLKQARQDFDRAVEQNLPNARELGEHCAHMAMKLIEDVDESPGMSGAYVPETSLRLQEANEATVKHAQDARSFAHRVLKEVLREMRQERRAQRGGSDMPDAA
jgi:hypothetical protein